MTLLRLMPALLALPLSAQTLPAIENDQVRVLVVTDQPKHRSALHEHKVNRVMIYLDPGMDRITYADGHVEDLKFRANEVRWSPAGGKHTSENIGERPFRIVEVELNDGRRLVEQADERYRGGPDRPFTREELHEKFTECAESALPQSAITETLSMLESLTDVSDISDLVRVMSPPKRPGAVSLTPVPASPSSR